MSLDTAALATAFPSDSTYTTNHGWAAIAGVAVLGFGVEPMIENIAEEILLRTFGLASPYPTPFFRWIWAEFSNLTPTMAVVMPPVHCARFIFQVYIEVGIQLHDILG